MLEDAYRLLKEKSEECLQKLLMTNFLRALPKKKSVIPIKLWVLATILFRA